MSPALKKQNKAKQINKQQQQNFTNNKTMIAKENPTPKQRGHYLLKARFSGFVPCTKETKTKNKKTNKKTLTAKQ